MAEIDSGVETGNESNESMSVESSGLNDEDKNISDIEDKYEPGMLSFNNLSVASCSHYNFVEYSQKAPAGKIKQKVVRFPRNNISVERDDVFGFSSKRKYREKEFRVAATNNDIVKVRKLLDEGVDPCTADAMHRSALHFVAAAGHSEIAQLLLERGANPNQRDSVGNTPLHLAACTTRIKMVTLLLKAGTDIHASDYSGRSPFQLAQSKLKLLHRNTEYSSSQVKQEVVHVLEMMQVYLQRSGRSVDMGFLNAFSNRLQYHQTREEVNTDVRDLLSSLSHLSLQNA